jgi:predicted metallopeptidase
LAGAETKEIATAVPTGYAATLACASIYVPYLNFMRKKFKTSSFEDKVKL